MVQRLGRGVWNVTGHPTLRRLAGLLLRLVHRIEIQGLDHVPTTGRLILAVTHCGVRGGLILETYLARDVVFVVSARFLRFPVIRNIAQQMGGVFVSSTDMLDTRLLDEASEVLAGDHLLGVMVQGRQMDEVAGQAKRGAAYLAYRLGADILPVQVSTRGLRLHIRFGELLPHPVSARAHLLNRTMAAVCTQLGIGWRMAT
jgi:1-acyl-sn-glycerol-3-phosphate acyltransferase